MAPDDLPINRDSENECADEHCIVSWQYFNSEHPALPGHFPGRPVIPGVVILQHIHELLRQRFPRRLLRSLPVVKFVRQLLPGELLLLGIEPGTATAQGIQHRFVCRCGTQTVAHGTLVASTPTGAA
jgi:3-hydroxyacyl-[acyl-carrier-protein] dehydratase